MSTNFATTAAACVGLALALHLSPVIAQQRTSVMNHQELSVVPGDVIAQRGKNGAWHVLKILQVDSDPGSSPTAHCLSYNDAQAMPTVESVSKLSVRIWHAPIAAQSFSRGWERITNKAATKDELVGFVEYLKLTDFPRYVAFTGQDSKAIVRRANEHYQRAYQLGEKGQRIEAIAEYTKAIDLFPLFYEAIDNRAFTYMELAKYKEALADFEHSLTVNPGGVAAFFSKGECLLRLGQAAKAAVIFKEGITRFPEQRANFEKFLEVARSAARSGG